MPCTGRGWGKLENLIPKHSGFGELVAWFLGEQKTDAQNFIPLLNDKCYIQL